MTVQLNAQYIVSPPLGRRLREGELLLLEGEPNFRLLLLSGGGYQLCTHRGECLQGKELGLYLIPQGEVCSLRAVAGEVQILNLSFRAHPGLCHQECPSKLRGLKASTKCGSLGTEAEGASRARPRRSRASINSLRIVPATQLWLDSMFCLLELGEADIRHFDMKIEELFSLMKLAYPLEEVEAFLKHYHCRIEGFRGSITSAYRGDMEVSDLYTLGEQMGLSEMSFKRSFAEEFGMSPRSWLIEQRAKAIYRELLTTDKPLKELSYEFGFCSVSHFGVFCKQALGDTPMHIRKGVAKPSK